MTYGINNCSVLNKLDDFPVCNGQLPQDIMHVLIQGAIPYTLKAMLQSFISDKNYFSISTINEKIMCFKFSRTESKSKPCTISSKILNGEGSIHQSGTQFFSMCSLYMLAMLIHFSESDVELSS